MRATVDPDLCTGCGLCEEVCPEVFEMNADGVAESNVDQVSSELEGATRDAADQCPVEAITIQD